MQDIKENKDYLSILSKNKISTQFIKNHGRSGISNTYIKQGECILSSQPFSYCISFENISLYCNQCFKLLNDKKNRCSGCHKAKYCSRSCQLSAWKYHKKECKIWKNNVPWDKLKNNLSNDDSSTILLIIRLLLNKLISNISKNNYYTNWDIIEGLCGRNKENYENNNIIEYNNITFSFDYKTSIILSKYIIDIIGNHINITHKECEDILIKMQKNNFQIVNELFESIGSSIYPIGALLNHSCEPNIILTYTYNDSLGIFEQNIRAIKNINIGDELVLSYLDTALITSERQRHLYKQYEFICLCNKCTQEQFKDKSTGQMLSNIDKILLGYKDQEITSIISNHLNEADELYNKAVQEYNPVNRITILKNCLSIRQKYLHPYSLYIFMVKTILFESYIEIQDKDKAIDFCKDICDCYENSGMYGFPNENSLLIHPIIGLQYYTLGNLLFEKCYDIKESNNLVPRVLLQQTRNAYQKSYDILSITHGIDHYLVINLHEQLTS